MPQFVVVERKFKEAQAQWSIFELLQYQIRLHPSKVRTECLEGDSSESRGMLSFVFHTGEWAECPGDKEADGAILSPMEFVASILFWQERSIAQILHFSAGPAGISISLEILS